MIEVIHPGKLFLLGEFSIMCPGHSAVVVPVKQTMKGQITASDKTRISTHFGLYIPNQDVDHSLRYVEAAYNTAVVYLNLKQIELKPFNLAITSELDADGKKYGFGSSGVVIVTVLDAIFQYHGLTIDALTLFKLSTYTQFMMDEMSSGGDLAVAVYKIPLAYTRYDTESLTEDIACVDRAWRYLDIKPIMLNFKIAVGWTGHPYKTSDALHHAKRVQIADPERYQGYMDKAQHIVEAFIHNPDNISLITAYRDWMHSFQTWSKQGIETEALTALIQIAEALGYPSKVSGAGGGDCGIAVSFEDMDVLCCQWSAQGILPVEI